jgi:hypothetical protein
MAYFAQKTHPNPPADELRSRIPGWGADLDPAVRPSVPRERFDLDTGAHWDFPDRQPELEPRERSIEHLMLPPVFGTAQPLRGPSGAVRRFSYARLSEGRASHWLLLILADRMEALEHHGRSLFSRHPDNPITLTGVLAEPRHRPIHSRFGRKRADVRHQWMDPILVAGPWLAVGAGLVIGIVKLSRHAKR